MRPWVSLGAMFGIGCAAELVEGPLEGPGFDEETGDFIAEGDEFIVGITHLQVKNAPRPGDTFGDHADAVGNYLFEEEPEGWLGAAFRNEGRLKWWTLTVWTSEEAMMEFVLSEPHASAMVDFGDIVTGGRSMHRTATADELPMDWSVALASLEQDPGFLYGETAWPADAEADSE